jgi:hypothetical protein
MPQVDTLGRLLLKDAVPEDLRHLIGPLDKKNTGKLYQAIAELYPEKYREIAKKIADISTQAGYESGGYSFGIEDMQPHPETAAFRQAFDADVTRILSDRTLSPKMRDAALIKAALEHGEPIRDSIMKQGLAAKNPLAMQVASGAKGKPENLKALVAGDSLYQDQNFNPVPYPITRSFAEGLTPAQYFAGTFGARFGIISTKLCLAGDTLVRMADGSTKEIRSIAPGDVVVGCGLDGVTSPTKVVAVHDNGLRFCRKYAFREFMSTKSVHMTATPDHRILGYRLYKNGVLVRNRDAQNECLPLKSAPTLYRGAAIQGGAWGGTNEPRALVLGVMLGDGYLGRDDRSSGHSLQFSCADSTLIEDLRPYFAAIGQQLKKIGDGYSYVVTRPNTRGGTNPLIDWLRDLRLFGTRSRDKFIPDCVWGWDDQSVAQLLGGLIATDGCVFKHGKRPDGKVTFSSVSRPMIDSVRQLLAVRFGIHCSQPSTQSPDKRTNAVYPLHTIDINYQESIKRLATRVPVPGVKGPRLTTLAAGLVQTEKTRAPRYNPLPKETVDVGEIPTYDLEVEHPSHLFVLANGLIVHNSTASGGWLAKRLSNSAHRLLVSAHDGHDRHATTRGYEVDVSDPANEGALLAHPVTGYDRDTVLTRDVLADLKRRGVTSVLTRSPMVGGPDDGGVYGKDVGVRERGRIAPLGDYVGLAASQSLAEPLTQLLISSKHTGGVAGSTKGQKGFPVLDQLTTIPSTFPGGAVHAQHDGIVTGIREAPQGGRYIAVDGKEHYARPDLELSVKPGDKVEAGDIMTDGVENPAEYVQHKGIGEGRKRFVDIFRKLAAEAGFHPHRRNLELVTRGLIDHVRMEKETNDHVPGDIVSYTQLEHSYDPRPGSKDAPPKELLGHYLERPVLHHTIGTRIVPSMLPAFEKYGVQSVTAHAEPPPFSPVMVRSQDIPGADPEPFARFLGSNVEKGLLKGVHRGESSDTMGTSYAVSLGAGVDFGQKGKTVGWKPSA